MESNLNPKLDLEWLKERAVKITEVGWYYLRDKRVAIWKDDKVKFIGRWDTEDIEKEKND